MWVRAVRAVALLAVALPSLALAQSGAFRSAFSETTESFPEAVAIGDLDGDDVPDVVVATPDTRVGNSLTSAVTILQGQGTGEFFLEHKVAVNGFPSAMLLAPLDGDALPDLIVANSNGGSVSFLKGLGNSEYFSPPGPPISVGALPAGVAAAHLDDDGILDLVVVNQESGDGNSPGSVSILRGQGDGTYITVFQLDPLAEDPEVPVEKLTTDLDTRAVALGDLDEDGLVDIATLNTGANSITLFFNEGDLAFGNRATIDVGTGPSDIVLADVNDDDFLDVVTAASFAEDDGAVAVRLGNGNGTFGPISLLQAGNTPNGVAVDDMNGDGNADIVATNSRSGDVSVFLGNGDGSFSDARTFVANAEPVGLALADMDNNQTIDVVAITKAESGTATLLRNRGDALLDAVEDVLIGEGPSSIASGDFNNDAVPDLVVGTSIGMVLIYSPDPQLGFRLIQTVSIGGTLGSIAAVDLNSDAILDLAIVDRDDDRVVVLTGLGGAQFSEPISYAVEPRPSAIAAGDFNADGRVDLAVTTFGPTSAQPPLPNVTPLLRQASGMYTIGTPVAVEENPGAIAVADFSGDGRDDVAVANAGQSANTVSILFSNPNGSLSLNQTLPPGEVGQQPSSLAVADFNDDGRPDIAVADFLAGTSPATVRIFHSGEDGLLTFIRSLNAGNALEDIVARDFTGDSRYDLAVVVNAANQVTLFHERNGVLRALPPDNVSRRPINITAADFNDDGRYDIATGNEDPSANNVSVLINCIRDEGCLPENAVDPGMAAFRGDGNGDSAVSAADLVAVAQEVVDGDGKRVEDIARPGRPGYQASSGVDANGDGRVDRQDLLAVAHRLFSS